jgi:D-threo-aldose 1-dehydrogenase
VVASGVLADPCPHLTFGNRPVPDDLLRRVRVLGEICRRHGVDLLTAALRFPLLHPEVDRIVVGATSPGEVRQLVEAAAGDVPAALWDEL